jgi:hypothetical protein
MNTKTRKLGLENLEDRRLTAADLAFAPLAGDLYYDAPSSTDGKNVSGMDLGSGRIKGLSGTDLGSGRITADHDAVFAQYGR